MSAFNTHQIIVRLLFWINCFLSDRIVYIIKDEARLNSVATQLLGATNAYFAISNMEASAKRKVEDVSHENEDDDWIGPMPSEAVKPKKKKGKPTSNAKL